MEKRIFTKMTMLGLLTREMRFSDNGLYIHLYTIFPNGSESYDGTIERQYEHAIAVEWKKDFSFKEVL